ncbi:Endoplasmic reticulum aminopeptidase 2, partial [Stegodyphus mimosarum]
MAEEIVELDNGRLLTKFEKTVPMVTYLLAVVVCDFKFKETITENGVRLRIYTAPHHIEKTSYALEMGSKTL